jgi:peptidoglycan/LPS O-acetylase OafA/YrhL
VPASEPTTRSIGEALNGSNNSLGLIRLVLASVVLVDHAFPLGGFGADPVLAATNGQASLGELAVGGFFAISGYLIAKSGTSGDVVQFMWRRALRIFPAYWLVLIVTAFIVAPILWVSGGRGFADYFTTPGAGPVHYFLSNFTLTIGSYGIHDLLADTPYGMLVGGSVFNGSIWTLVYEWNCYLIIAVLMAFGVLRNARIFVPVLAGFFLLMQVVSMVDPAAVGRIIPMLADPHMISLGFTFLAGSVIATYSRQIPFDNRIGILSGILLLLTLHFGGFSTLGTAAGAYFVIYLAARLPQATRWIGAKNDYSYGVYIYGFLVQQIIAHLGWYQLGYVLFVLTSFIISFGCAWISWHLVEKRALQLKGWGPGRGWRAWFELVRAPYLQRKAKIE